MAEVKKARLFLRRGTDTDRKTTILCEGELGYSTDAFRVVVGDGTTYGGLGLGTTVFVSAGGPLAPGFHTTLTEASAGGFAMVGDIAVFPAATYVDGTGSIVTPSNTTGTSATTVVLLTGIDNSNPTHWVAVNSGIPWGNVDTPVDAISGEQIHGGDISGNVTFSGTLSTTALTSTSALIGGLAASGDRNVFVTSTGQLSSRIDGTAADGRLRWLTTSTPISTRSVNAAGFNMGWAIATNPNGVPSNASSVLLEAVYDAPVGSNNGTNQFITVRDSAAGVLEGRTIVRVDSTTLVKGAVQALCPLSAYGGSIFFDYRIYSDGTEQGFDNGFTLSVVGYM
tara:strand:- start:1836 stop:2852 length:1017 start_codon:yes stop_codon:yes gene_type:complete